jgi:cytochrome P450
MTLAAVANAVPAIQKAVDSATKPLQWMLLGSGPCHCLGENLAMMEMKVFIATLAGCEDYDLDGSTEEILWK